MEEKTSNMEDNMIPVTFVDEPLLVVLDDDDDDGGYADDHNFDLISKKSNEIVSKSVEEQQIDLVEISPNEYLEKQSEISIKNSTKKPKIFYHSSKSPRVLDQSNKLLSTTKNEKKKSQNQRRIKNRSKNKDVSSSTHQQDPYVMNHSTDSIFSFISFENTSNVLTVSRMGSIYYCIEDLYLKVFSTLCTLEEFIDLLLKPGIIHLIPMTLSEKISIEKLCSKLKEFNRTRYRLVTINSTEYLSKLKRLLSIHRKGKYTDVVIEEMQTFKCSSIYINPNNKDSSHLSTNDEIHQQNNYELDDLVETNKTISAKTVSEIILENISKYIMTDKQIQDMRSFESSHDKIEKCSSRRPENILFEQHTSDLLDINTKKVSVHKPTTSLKFSKSLNKQISRPSTSTSTTMQTNGNTMLECQSKTVTTKSMDQNNGSHIMPMIIEVEENVDFTKKNGSIMVPSNSQERSSSNQISSQNTITNAYKSPFKSVSHSHSQSQDPTRQTQIQSSRHILPRDEFLSSYENSEDVFCTHQTTESKHLSLQNMSVPQSQNTSISSQSSTCCLPSCTCQQTPKGPCLRENSILKLPPSISTPHYERTILCRQHKTPSCSKCTSTKVIISSKQHHIRSTPYPLIKTYFAPLNTTQSEMNKKESHRSRLHQPAPVHNSSTLISPPNTPNGLTLTKIPMSGINLSKAIARYGYSDIDKLPKLVVRYKKIYTFQTIDVMGQLFPTWFNEPDYRCVHCFTCDQVFTPQQFMTHIDDEKLANKQPIDITSIELLPSEKFSKHKVELWNQFCFNLAIHSKTGQIDGFIRYENL